MEKRTGIWVLNICKFQSWSLRRSLVSSLSHMYSFNPSFNLHVCGLTCASVVSGCTFTCVLLNVEPRGKPHHHHLPLLLIKCLSLKWSLPIRRASEPRIFPAFDYKNELNAWWFYLGPGVQAEALVLVRQVFYWVSHVAPPSHLFIQCSLKYTIRKGI